MKYSDLSLKEKRMVLKRTGEEMGIPEQIVEKDWWVTTVLRALFSLPYSDQLSFKGGTSLSKCWGFLDRMSEDVDIAVNREFLGFTGKLSKTQISDKLRRASCSFVREKLKNDLSDMLVAQGINSDSFFVTVNITSVSTTDPETIIVSYKSAVDSLDYIIPKVLIEVSGRSMSEPLETVRLNSFIETIFPGTIFSEPPFTVLAVSPQRTFLEKIFLLSEEFTKSADEIRVNRMSRHLYDVFQLMNTPIAEKALNNRELYDSIVEHRRSFIGLKGFNYNLLSPENLSINVPSSIEPLWRDDYEKMCRTMVYSQAPSFDSILEKIAQLNKEINKKLPRS